MLSKTLEQAFNEQIRNEFYSAYYYLSMAAWLESKSLKGFANWYYVQVEEENDHAIMMLSYVLRTGGKLYFYPIDSPPTEFESVADIVQKTLEHEQLVTSKINKLMNFAQQESDHKTIQFLEWYVKEQVEEEENASGLIERLKIAESTNGGVLYMDTELAARAYSPPSIMGAED